MVIRSNTTSLFWIATDIPDPVWGSWAAYNDDVLVIHPTVSSSSLTCCWRWWWWDWSDAGDMPEQDESIKPDRKCLSKQLQLPLQHTGGLRTFCDFVMVRNWDIVFKVIMITFSAIWPSKSWMRWVSLYLASAIGSIAAQYGDDGWVDELKNLISERLNFPTPCNGSLQQIFNAKAEITLVRI